jgi:membrane protease YdiL (CAAX protease family)
MPKKETTIKHVTILAVYLLLVWGFYRFLFKQPEEIEELLIKPVLWLIPVFYLIKKEKTGISSLGITGKNLFQSIYFALSLAVVFTLEGVFINFLKYGEFNFSANLGQRALFTSLGLSLVTAVTEEITFRGYIFNRVWNVLGREWFSNILVSIIWGIIHIPIAIFWWDLTLSGTIGYILLTITFGIGSAFVFARTKNVISSILLHTMWVWPIILFR